MLLLLDTHILLTLSRGESELFPRFIRDALRSQDNAFFASAVSLWEIAIKHRLGKLALAYELEEWPGALAASAIALMDIGLPHLFAEADPPPETRDPFGRLLLAICHVDKMRLVTLDRSLVDHPLSLRPASA